MDYRSPLDNIFNIISALPQGHDKPIKHALYNAVAILLLIVCCCAVCALYMILEPFIKPLIWALLVGSVLHPIKHRLAQQMRSWFELLDEFRTPVVVGICISPFKLMNNLSEFIGNQILARIKFIIFVVIMLPLMHVLYNYTPRLIITLVWNIGMLINYFLLLLIGNATFTMVTITLIGYVTTLIFLWKPSNNKQFHLAAIGVWLFLTGFISNQMGSLQIPIFILLQVVLIAGFIFEIIKVKEDLLELGHQLSFLDVFSFTFDSRNSSLFLQDSKKDDEIKDILQAKDSKSFSEKEGEIESSTSEKTSLNSGDTPITKQQEDIQKLIFSSNKKPENDPWSLDLFEENSAKFDRMQAEKIKHPKAPINNTGLLITDKGKIHVIQPAPTNSEIFNNTPKSNKVKRSLSQPHVTGPNQTKSFTGLFTLRKRSDLRNSSSGHKSIQTDEYASHFYMYSLVWACGIMIFWKHMWLLPILPIPILIYVTKHFGVYLGLWQWLYNQWIYLREYMKSWFSERYDALVPLPIRGMCRFFFKIDDYIKENLKESIDAVASSVVIFGLIIFAVCASIFLVVQVYAEAIMLVQMFSNVFNQTVVHNPELRQLLPPSFDDTVDSILDNAYQYGREGISKAVRGMMSEVDPIKSEKLEKQVLELFDRLYQAWMTSETTNGPKVTTNAVTSSWEAFIEDIQKSPEIFNLNGIIDFGKQNLGMLMSLLESIWVILKGNISLVLGSVSAFVSVLLGGGTAVLNFILNMIIFFTTLFYLLSSSGNYYKPVEIMTNFSTSGSRFGLALEGAINGVFTASFKMSIFYGMWTWFIHNLFGVQIVYLPTVFAAILGAAPFLGTYWACIPAVLDLWLAQEKGICAILILAFQFMPTYIVDTVIYAEIKGGGHPYLTGLAIAGGIFCLGLEGAIIGPLVLCGLYVAMDLSTTLFKDSPSEESLNIQQLSR